MTACTLIVGSGIVALLELNVPLELHIKNANWHQPG